MKKKNDAAQAKCLKFEIQEKPKLNGDHHIKGDSVEVTPLSSSNTKYVVSVAQKL